MKTQIALLLIVSSAVQAYADTELSELNDVSCGPRCVQKVLREFQVETAFVELMQEMSIDSTLGVRMSDLVDSLTKRDVFAKSVYIDAPVYRLSLGAQTRPVIGASNKATA